MSAEQERVQQYAETAQAMHEDGEWPSEEEMQAAAQQAGLSESDMAQVHQMAQASREQANAMMQQGDLDGAIQQFAQAVPLQPTDPDLLTEAATAHANRFQEWGNPSDLAAAENLAGRALELAPELPAAAGLMNQITQAAAPAARPASAAARRAAPRAAAAAAAQEEAGEEAGGEDAGNYTQEGRSMRVDTVLDEDELLLHSFTGVEGISTPYSFRLRLLSENDSVSADDLLRTPAFVSIELENGEVRYFHGFINRFAAGDQAEDLREYEAEIVPWLWFLSLSRDCKIFQEKTVLEIVEEVFTGLGYSDFDIRCTRSYPQRTYCVQYRESHLNFISRLLEEEGIFYFFEHTDQGHVLVIADDNSSIEELEHKPTAAWRSDPIPEEDVVTALRSEKSVHVGTVTLQDYDFEQPSMDLLSSIAGEEEQEIYDYHPRRYTELEEGERYARLALEALEAGRQVVYGEGNCRAFTTGYRFALEDYISPPLNQPYTLAQISHSGSAGDYRSGGSTEGDYQNSFLAVPHDVPYRPQPVHRKPTVHGSQTAIVVGPSGEEIYTDQYGRVKVQFYWDRVGGRDENSSCWIRVGTPWGGGGYGSVSIPRIGNEVIIDFLEGDPDRPLIVGSVYNANQMPPLELPGAGIEMGMRSRSSPGGGGANQISMRDTAGEEMMTVTAQYDMNTSVGNDQSHSVGNNRTSSVSVDETSSVGSNQSLDVGSNQTISVGADQSLTVSGSQTVDVSGAQSVTVGGGRALSVTGDNTVDASGNHAVTAGGDIELTGTNLTVTASAAATYQSGAATDIVAGGPISITGASISLSAGGSSINIGPGSIDIVAGGMVTIVGALVKIN
jgi:type VI secretion system secreted protein VgrG